MAGYRLVWPELTVSPFDIDCPYVLGRSAAFPETSGREGLDFAWPQNTLIP